MKKILTTLLLSCVPLFVFAQEIEIPQKIDEIKQKIEDKKFIFSEEINEKRKEIKEKNIISTPESSKVQVLTQEKLLEVINHTLDKFEAVCIKFEGIISRLDLRISKLEEQGVDTSSLKEVLENRKDTINDMTILILATRAELENSAGQQVNFKQIKEIISEYKKSLKETQDALIIIIESLKYAEEETQEDVTLE